MEDMRNEAAREAAQKAEQNKAKRTAVHLIKSFYRIYRLVSFHYIIFCYENNIAVRNILCIITSL